MRKRATLLALTIAILAGCQAQPGPTATPAVTAADGIEGLVAELVARGAGAKVGAPFLSEPIGGQGTAVCIGSETLQTYEFIDHEAALAAAARIDRDDPSNVGTGIVEWNGPPRFWLRSNLVILYLGRDAVTDALLRAMLGRPFAESQNPGRGFLPTPPCQ